MLQTAGALVHTSSYSNARARMATLQRPRTKWLPSGQTLSAIACCLGAASVARAADCCERVAVVCGSRRVKQLIVAPLSELLWALLCYLPCCKRERTELDIPINWLLSALRVCCVGRQ